MFRYWTRELAGWLLVLLGLGFFYLCLALLLNPQPSILEVPAISIIGIVVFRGGIHLLKVAVAARICLQAQMEINKQSLNKRPNRKEMPRDW